MASEFFAGCLGGCAGILVGHPLDTIKVRIQTQDFRNPKYKGTIDCFKTIVRQESVSGFYKGMSSPLAGVALINAVVFGVYGNIQRNLAEPESLKSHFFSGAIAGLVQSFVCSPMEMIKSRMQMNTGKVSSRPLHCLRDVFKMEGIPGIFRGLNVTFLREGLGFGLYFSTYEWLTRNEGSNQIGTLHLLTAGGLSGAISWFFTYPLDVIKSRIQIDGISGVRLYKNSFDCLIKSTREEGIRFLFRGLSPTLVRAFPTNAATWATVTWTLRLIKADAETEMAKTADSDFRDDYEAATNAGILSYDFSFLHNLCLKYLTDESS